MTQMKFTPKFYGVINDNKISFDDKGSFLLWLNKLEGNEVEITVAKRNYHRTSPQNNYYWGVVVELLAEAFGWDSEDMHEFLKSKFSYKIVSRNGEEYRITRSTASLGTHEFIDYIEKCVRFAADQGVVIPEPHQIILED